MLVCVLVVDDEGDSPGEGSTGTRDLVNGMDRKNVDTTFVE